MSYEPTRPMRPPSQGQQGQPGEQEQQGQEQQQEQPTQKWQSQQGQPGQQGQQEQPTQKWQSQQGQPGQQGQQGQPGQPGQRGWQSPQAQPAPQGWQSPQGQPGQQGQQGWQSPQGQPAPQGQQGWQGQQGNPPTVAKRRRRRGRRSVIATFIIIVVAILLVIGDRVSNAIAENDMASQFKANGLPVKPSVDITGFPFLTQLAARDFKQVDVTASNIPAGPVTITSLNATLTGMHVSSSFASATIDNVKATIFVSFGALAAAGGLGGTAVTVTPDGANTVKVTAGVGGVLSDTEEVQITQTGPQQISLKVLDSGSVLGSLLSSFGSYSFSLPQGVPASLKITGLTLNSQGLTVNAAATDATFSK